MRQVSLLCKRGTNSHKVTFRKKFSDLVTYVDKNSEKILIAGLQKILPGSGILAEESGEHPTPSNSPQGGAIRSTLGLLTQ